MDEIAFHKKSLKKKGYTGRYYWEHNGMISVKLNKLT
jgi:hypothetical protein